MIRLKVTELDPSAAAIKAGVQVGDYLDKYDDVDLNTTKTLVNTVANANSSQHTICIFRDGGFISLACDPGRLGVTVEEVDIEFERDSGLLIHYRNAKQAELIKLMDGITITTTNNVDGYTSEVIDIITSECVFGMNLFKDFFAAVSDVFGGRSSTTQKVLRDARKTCLNEMRREAAQLGADGVIGVKLDYSEFSGGGKSMLFLVASGTAVKLKQVEKD